MLQVLALHQGESRNNSLGCVQFIYTVTSGAMPFMKEQKCGKLGTENEYFLSPVSPFGNIFACA